MTSITNRVARRARKRYGLTVYSHRQWGSTCRDVYRQRRKTRPVVNPASDDLVVQHITVTRPSGNAKADARTVERIGMERFGSGVSYNFLVDMATGEVCIGQPLDAKGTHTVNDKHLDGYAYNLNYTARAIAVVGMPETKLSLKAAHAIAGLLAAMIDENVVSGTLDYRPHSDFAWKDCPCEATRSTMPHLFAKARHLRAEPEGGDRRRRRTRRPWLRGAVGKARSIVRQARERAEKAGHHRRATWLGDVLRLLREGPRS